MSVSNVIANEVTAKRVLGKQSPIVMEKFPLFGDCFALDLDTAEEHRLLDQRARNDKH